MMAKIYGYFLYYRTSLVFVCDRLRAATTGIGSTENEPGTSAPGVNNLIEGPAIGVSADANQKLAI